MTCSPAGCFLNAGARSIFRPWGGVRQEELRAVNAQLATLASGSNPAERRASLFLSLARLINVSQRVHSNMGWRVGGGVEWSIAADEEQVEFYTRLVASSDAVQHVCETGLQKSALRIRNHAHNCRVRIGPEAPDMEIGDAAIARAFNLFANFSNQAGIGAVQQDLSGVAHEPPGPAGDHEGADDAHQGVEPDPAAKLAGRERYDRKH